MSFVFTVYAPGAGALTAKPSERLSHQQWLKQYVPELPKPQMKHSGPVCHIWAEQGTEQHVKSRKKPGIHKE